MNLCGSRNEPMHGWYQKLTFSKTRLALPSIIPFICRALMEGGVAKW